MIAETPEGVGQAYTLLSAGNRAGLPLQIDNVGHVMRACQPLIQDIAGEDVLPSSPNFLERFSNYCESMTRMAMIREKVYDPVLRFIHAWIGLTILLLLVGGLVAKWIAFTPEAVVLWRLHVWLGYGLVLGLVARLMWSIYGPKHAHWSQLWTWRAWLAALRNRTLFTPPSRFGHHPLATGVYLALYALLLVMAVTGLAMAAIEQAQGPLYPWLGHDVLLKPWFSLPHDVLEEFILAFVLIHIAALILHEERHGIPLAQAMVSGYQYREDGKE